MENERDLHFTAQDFRRVREMVYDHAGIALSDAKNDMAYARLAKRVRAMGEQHFSNYLDVLAANPVHPEWQSFINALTTNLTAFFREAHHFEMLGQHYCQHADRQVYRVWSSAVSTGEEAWSIAMTLSQTKPPQPCRFEIFGSDIDTNVLKTAANAVYANERVELLSKAQLKAFFLNGCGANEGKVRIKPEIRQLVTLLQLNLVGDRWPDLGLFDVVFCRNVMIYFDADTQRTILHRLADRMQPHALLFLGHSENIQMITDAFIPCGRTSYRLSR